MIYTFTIEVDTDDVIGAKEHIAMVLEDICKVRFTDIKNRRRMTNGVKTLSD